MIEPGASPRLQRLRDVYESLAATPADLPTPPTASFLPARVRSIPSASVSSSPLDPARPSPRPLADGYVAFRERAFGAEPVSTAFLATIAAQAAALALVWEAHARGVATLPPAVAAAVSAARAIGH